VRQLIKSFNDALADKQIERAIMLQRYGGKLGKDILLLLDDTAREIQRRLPSVTGTQSKKRLEKELRDIQSVIKTAYGQAIESTALSLSELAKNESAWQIKTTNILIGADLFNAIPTAVQLEAIASNTMISGGIVGDWWGKQSNDTAFRFSNAVRLGMAQSETNYQISRRVADVMKVSRRNAFALVKTSAQAVAMAAREKVWDANSKYIKGKMSLATLDSHTSAVCAACDRAQYDLNNKPINGTSQNYLAIPRHFGCRSTWTVLTKSFAELDLPFQDFTPSARASMDGQVSADSTFNDFLDGKPKAWQNEFLGKGKAELYRAGKITLADLIDDSGREVTLKKLSDH